MSIVVPATVSDVGVGTAAGDVAVACRTGISRGTVAVGAAAGGMGSDVGSLGASAAVSLGAAAGSCGEAGAQPARKAAEAKVSATVERTAKRRDFSVGILGFFMRWGLPGPTFGYRSGVSLTFSTTAMGRQAKRRAAHTAGGS